MAPSTYDGPGLFAPGASSSSGELRCPGSSSSSSTARMPRVDTRLAPPETRLEYLDGVELFAAPADLPHATQHFDLTYVLGAHVKEGYRGAVDMLTRTGEVSDFAPDASIFPVSKRKKGNKKGRRKLEELAFEVSDQQAISVPTRKARELIQRGVRRVFCILVQRRRVLEWSRATDGWEPLPVNAVIEDPCLCRPLPIEALLDAVAADDAVARALLDKRVPALEEAFAARESSGEARGEARGKLASKREAILVILRERGLAVPALVAAQIAACDDKKTLDRWLRRAVTIESASALPGTDSGKKAKASKRG